MSLQVFAERNRNDTRQRVHDKFITLENFKKLFNLSSKFSMGQFQGS